MVASTPIATITTVSMATLAPTAPVDGNSSRGKSAKAQLQMGAHLLWKE